MQLERPGADLLLGFLAGAFGRGGGGGDRVAQACRSEATSAWCQLVEAGRLPSLLLTVLLQQRLGQLSGLRRWLGPACSIHHMTNLMQHHVALLREAVQQVALPVFNTEVSVDAGSVTE